MTIANCPRCSEQVSVPDSASRDATVRCPFCQDEYSLAEALAQLPPSLIVVSDFAEMAAPDIADEEDSGWGALDLDDDDVEEIALAPLGDAAPAAPFDFMGSSVATTSSKPKTAVRPSSRSRKPKGSPIKSVLSIVLGGLMAFPIAQLILWYLPGEWKRDFGVGPIVAQYVPVIVPAKFRGSSANADSNSEPARQDSEAVIPDFNMSGFGGFGADDTDSGEDVSADHKKGKNPKKQQNTTDSTAFNEEPPAEERMSLDDAPVASEDVFTSPLEVPGLELGGLPLLDAPASPSELPSAITKTIDAPATKPSAPDNVPPEILVPEVEVTALAPGNLRNAPHVNAAEVAQNLQAALSGNEAWNASGGSVPTGALKKEFYLAFSKLGEALAFADRADAEVAARIPETAQLLQEVGTQPDKLAVIESVANGWIALSHEKRTTDGICVYGVVTSVESIGNLFETTVESAGQQIAVVSTSDPSEYFAPDRQVLILGTILDNPAKNLGGYEGSRSVVVFEGHHAVLAAE